MGACNQGGKVLEFYGGVVTRTLVRFSRNNMKGALSYWKNPMGAKRQKGKFPIFSFFGVLEGSNPLRNIRF